jgi:hypothetical protein
LNQTLFKTKPSINSQTVISNKWKKIANNSPLKLKLELLEEDGPKHRTKNEELRIPNKSSKDVTSVGMRNLNNSSREVASSAQE